MAARVSFMMLTLSTIVPVSVSQGERFGCESYGLRATAHKPIDAGRESLEASKKDSAVLKTLTREGIGAVRTMIILTVVPSPFKVFTSTLFDQR